MDRTDWNDGSVPKATDDNDSQNFYPISVSTIYLVQEKKLAQVHICDLSDVLSCVNFGYFAQRVSESRLIDHAL